MPVPTIGFTLSDQRHPGSNVKPPHRGPAERHQLSLPMVERPRLAR
jgi:hypothetical protein